MGAAHAQRLRRDFLEVALLGKEERAGVVGHLLRFFHIGGGVLIDDHALARLTVFFRDRAQLLDNDGLDARLAFEDIVQLGNLLFQILDILGAFKDILAVEVAQLDFRDILRLNLVDAEADHQVGNDLDFLVGFADDLDCFINIEQDFLQTAQQMQPLRFFGAVKVGAALDTLHAECDPLIEQFSDTHDARNTRNQYIKVTGVAVLERGQLEELSHQLVGIGAALQVHRDFETVKTCFIADIGNLPDLSLLDEIDDFFDNHLAGRRRGNRQNIDAVGAFVVDIFRAQADASPARFIDLTERLFIIENLAAAAEIGCGQCGEKIVPGVADQGCCRLADFAEVKGADVGRHADGDTCVGVDQHRRENGRQQ